MFIQLTEWNARRFGPWLGQHGRALWINPSTILSLHTITEWYAATQAEAQAPISERPTETYTVITFAVGFNEDYITYNVQETPAEIISLINSR